MQTVAVIGAGAMGTGIAQAFSQGEWQVRIHDADAAAPGRARARIEASLQKQVGKGRLSAPEAEATMARVTAAPELDEAVRDADLVIEAIYEDLTAKQALFSRLGDLTDAVLATNTSSFRVADLAAVTARPERVVGLHFFFPAHVNRLVEVIRTSDTSEQVFTAAQAAAASLGKTTIQVADAPGFCVNRFLLPWMNEACRLLDEGVADVPSIEVAAREGLGVTLGPFAVMDLSGLTVCHHAVATLGRELGPAYAPSPALATRAAEGTPWDPTGTPQPVPETVVRRLRGVVWRVARDIVDGGIATQEDVDTGATVGLRWPLGPFALMARLSEQEVANDLAALPPVWRAATTAVPARSTRP